MLKFGGGGLVAKLCSTLVTLWTVACQAPLSKSTGLGCHFLLQGIYPPQELNQSLHCRQILY